jgi:type I restriction enzyme S subunit
MNNKQSLKNWQYVRLSELYTFRYGDGNRNPDNGGIYPVYGAHGIIGFYDKYNAEDSIVIGHMGEYAGAVLLATGKHFVTYNGTIGIPKDRNKLHYKFGYYALLYSDLRKVCGGSGQPFLSYPQLNTHIIKMPLDTREQERIASALSDVDGLIMSLRQLIEKKRNIKTGVMKELLSGKKRLKGFSEEWKVEYLGNIADLYQPHTIGGNCFTNYGFDVYGANGIIGKYSSYNHETDQVLITCRGNTCGTINYSKGKCWINGNAMVVNMDNYDICKRFIYYYLTFQDFSSVISGSGQPQITRKPLNELKLFIPPTKAEQEAIAKVLSDMDAEIEQLEMRLTKYEDIKQGMMQQLLTGKIRLI